MIIFNGRAAVTISPPALQCALHVEPAALAESAWYLHDQATWSI
jgi:hypothetical protein